MAIRYTKEEIKSLNVCIKNSGKFWTDAGTFQYVGERKVIDGLNKINKAKRTREEKKELSEKEKLEQVDQITEGLEGLMLGIEFILKALYLERGYCINTVDNDKKPPTKIENIKEENVNPDKTHGLAMLLDNINIIFSDKSIEPEKLEKIKKCLNTTRNNVIHAPVELVTSDEIRGILIDLINSFYEDGLSPTHYTTEELKELLVKVDPDN